MNPCQKITSNHPFDWYPTWQRSCGIFRDLGDRTAEAMQQRAANFSSLFVEVEPSSIAVSPSRRVWGWNLPLLSKFKIIKMWVIVFFPCRATWSKTSWLQVESLLQVAVAQLEAWCILKVHGNPKSDVFLFVGGGFSNIFHVHPAYLVKIPILTDIFQKGWNHQPVLVGGRLQIIADWMKSFSDGLKPPTSFWRMPRQFCKEWD